MNQDQVIASGRNLLSMLGGVAIGRGWITADMLTAMMGLVPGVVGMYFAWKAASTQAQKTKVIQQDDVVSITKTDGTVITTPGDVK